eukprot:1158109-Pelagomonas_calceolata.AAC.8
MSWIMVIKCLTLLVCLPTCSFTITFVQSKDQSEHHGKLQRPEFINGHLLAVAISLVTACTISVAAIFIVWTIWAKERPLAVDEGKGDKKPLVV